MDRKRGYKCIQFTCSDWVGKDLRLDRGNKIWSVLLVQVCVGANNTYIDPVGISTVEELLTNLINISLVKIKHLE